MGDLRNPSRSMAPKANLMAALVSLALLLVGGRAFAQGEAPPAAPAVAPAPPAEAPPPAAPPPAEAPKCECPPPCPAPPPAPPPPPADLVEWKAQSKGGLVLAGGNSQATNVTFGLNASRKQGNNKLALEGGMAYGRTKNLAVATTDGGTPPTIVSLDRKAVVSTNNWAAKARYDRFLTANNTLYASGLGAADQVAGKSFFGGGQVGYSRQLLKDKWNLVVAEAGYDVSYERYVQNPGKHTDPVSIHSARVVVGETLSLNPQTGVTASVEVLLNINKETKAINAGDGTNGVDALKDTRVNGKLGLSTNLHKQLSLGLSFAFKYDQNPAPRPVPAGAPAGTSFPSTYAPWAYANELDTLTEATLIYTFF